MSFVIIEVEEVIMATGSSSCSCHMAGAFPGLTREELLEKMEDVWDEFSYDFPYFDVKERWKVTLLHKGLFKHYSLLLTVPGCHEGLLIHLIVDEENRLCLDFCMVDLSEINEKSLKQNTLGTTPKPMTADTIIRGAHDLLVSMGSYNAALNNCQDYCQKVAEFLGVSIPFTGAEAVAAGGGATVAAGVTGAVIGLGLYGLYKLFSSGDDDKEDDDKRRCKK